MLGEGGGRNCGKQFSELAEKAGAKLFASNPNRLQSWLGALASYSKPSPPKSGQYGTDSRLEDVVRLSAEYCEQIADIEGATERPSFANFVIPNFRYFPSLLMDKQGPKQWARFRLLQACERLKIRSDLWPKFTDLDLPRQQYAFSQHVALPFPIPAFHRLYESESEWRERVHKDLNLFLDKYADNFDAWFKEQITKGHLTKIKTTRETSPLDLRYEWAARRYCLREAYKSMSSDEWSADRIRKVVARIFVEIGLKDRK
jgi:hypothetical protein